MRVDSGPLAEHHHTRRTFLAAAGAAALGGGLLAGCSDAADQLTASDRLVGFIALSQLVTGETDLPVQHAPAFQAALEAAGLEVSPTDLAVAVGLARSGGPFDLAELQRSSAYRQPGGEAAARALAA
ncbi:MAG TPA: sugar dehydrogenase complex small subunit, partial [Capillimicrobium sp.]